MGYRTARGESSDHGGGWGAGRGQGSRWLGPGRWQRVSGCGIGGRVGRMCWRVNCQGPFPVLLTSDLTPLKQEFLVCRSQLPLHRAFRGRKEMAFAVSFVQSWRVERAGWIEALNLDVDREGSSHPVRRKKWRPATPGPSRQSRAHGSTPTSASPPERAP